MFGHRLAGRAVCGYELAVKEIVTGVPAGIWLVPPPSVPTN
jgi:hypothetical protein